LTASILVADHQAVVRHGLRALLETQDGWKIIAEASNGHEALAHAVRFRPDIIIMDLLMPQMDGLDATRRVLDSAPESRILALGEIVTEGIIEKALRAGALGYVRIADAERDLIPAVEALLQGRTFFTAQVVRQLCQDLRQQTPTNGHSALTPREAEIVQRLAEGGKNRELAKLLGLSIRTVENHRARIMKKLNLSSFSDLVRYAVRSGLVEP
jgi:DNA-binding NarL/FixJ family response regulator